MARTMAVIGDRWTILVLRDFFVYGPRKFQELADSFPGLSPNLLSNRIKKLMQAGILESQLYSEHPPRNQYLLTRKGHDLGPILLNLRDWGNKHTRAS